MRLVFRSENAGGAAAHVPCSVRGAAAARLAAEELSRLAGLVERSPDLLREIQLRGGRYRCRYASPSHVAVLGLERSLFTSADPICNAFVHPDDEGELATKLAAWARHLLPLPHIFERREKAASGEWRTFEAVLLAHPMRPECVALVLRDVTERTEAHALRVAAAIEAAGAVGDGASYVAGRAPEGFGQAQACLEEVFVWPSRA